MAIAAFLLVASCSRNPLGVNDNTWRFLPGHVEPFSVKAFRNGRPCWVYLPPGYAQSKARYPVLYLNDGEVAFDGPDCMHVNRICEDLIRGGEIEPIIVVAIAHGTDADRIWDLTPWFTYYFGDPSGGGEFYLQAIRDTLKPAIDHQFRTLTDSRNTGIAGMSLGGLLAGYAAFAHDSTFGKVGAFSPTYVLGRPELFDLVRSVGKPKYLVRFYEDTGYPDDNYIDEMEFNALQVGFTLGMDFMSVTVDGAGHGVNAWEHRFPNMLRFLFGKPAT